MLGDVYACPLCVMPVMTMLPVGVSLEHPGSVFAIVCIGASYLMRPQPAPTKHICPCLEQYHADGVQAVRG